MSKLFDVLKGLGTAGALVAALIAAIWAVWTYRHELRVSFQKPMIEQNISICIQLVDVTSGLPQSITEQEWQLSQALFKRLRWGRSIVIESDELANALSSYDIRLFETEFSKRRQLEANAKDVALACREQLKNVVDEGWKIEKVDYSVIPPFTF